MKIKYDTYFTSIPNSVLYSTNISNNAKNLFYIILNLAYNEQYYYNGVCNSSNLYFSLLLKISERQVERYLTELKDAGLIEIFVESYIENGKIKKTRSIVINEENVGIIK